jgi:hypothetical protein
LRVRKTSKTDEEVAPFKGSIPWIEIEFPQTSLIQVMMGWVMGFTFLFISTPPFHTFYVTIS